MAKVARFGRLLPLGLSLLFAGCAAEPAGAQRIVGPDGTRMLHVHCGDEQVACFQIAGERCPYGYDLSPIFDPHDGNFLVRCRNPLPGGALASAAPAPAAAPVASVKPRPPTDGWPPPEVARPSEPWPTSSAAAPAPLPPGPPTPRTASGEVDVGY